MPTLFGVSVVVFGLVRLLPGDPITTMLGLQPTTPDQIARLRELLGLDQPPPLQYAAYVGRVVRGDLGQSIASGQDVASLVTARVPATLELTLLALALAALVAIPAGVLSAVRRGTGVDALARLAALVGVAAPGYWVGLLLIVAFAVQLNWLPASGYAGQPLWAATWSALQSGNLGPLWESLRYAILPAATLGFTQAAVLTRLVRSSMIETLGREFVRTARAKGLRERTVVYRHALRNGLIPVVTVLGLQFGALFGGAVIIETAFAWPGVGRLVVQSIFSRDYPVIQGAVLLFAVIRVVASLVVDLVYGVLDPRIRYA